MGPEKLALGEGKSETVGRSKGGEDVKRAKNGGGRASVVDVVNDGDGGGGMERGRV